MTTNSNSNNIFSYLMDLNTTINNKEHEKKDIKEQIDDWEQTLDTNEFINTIVSNNSELLLTILFGQHSKVHIPEHVWKDINFENDIFQHLDKTKTMIGKHILKKILQRPSDNVDYLLERQKVLKNMTLKHESVKLMLNKMSELENELMWFWKKNDDISFLYEMIYFQTPFDFVNNYLNNNSLILNSINWYNIFINPTMTIFIPIASFIIPYLILRYYNIKIPLKIIAKILFKQMMSWGMPTKLQFASTISMFIWIFFYGQNIYYSIMRAYYVHRIITFIQKKMTYIKELLDICENIYETLKDTGIIKYPPELTTLKSLLLEYNHDKKWFNNKGQILRTYNLLKERINELIPVLNWIGYVDAYNSIIMLSLNGYCYAQYITNENNPTIIGKNIYQIGLQNVKKNTVKLRGNNMLITGPNASGKSTFIKSMISGILLAQSLTISNMSNLQLTPYSVINSYIHIGDCSGKSSLFESEMNCMKEHLDLIIKANKNNEKVFIVMDELFSSTNYVEGFSISWAVLKSLISKNNSTAIVTTHYTDLSKIENISNYRFVEGYKLKRGVSKKYMALDMIKKRGFANELVETANEISEKVIKEIYVTK